MCIYMPAFVCFARPAIKHVFYPGIELCIYTDGLNTTSPVSAAARCVRVHTYMYIQSVVFPLRPAVLRCVYRPSDIS